MFAGIWNGGATWSAILSIIGYSGLVPLQAVSHLRCSQHDCWFGSPQRERNKKRNPPRSAVDHTIRGVSAIHLSESRLIPPCAARSLVAQLRRTRAYAERVFFAFWDFAVAGGFLIAAFAAWASLRSRSKRNSMRCCRNSRSFTFPFYNLRAT